MLASVTDSSSLCALRWSSCIVAATGPSLTPEIAEKCKSPVIAVNDAWRLIPWADVLYAADPAWWAISRPRSKWHRWDGGEFWSCTADNGKMPPDRKQAFDKLDVSIKIHKGREGNTFSTDPEWLHFGRNSGFQAINLAIHLGAKEIRLVGFDMQKTGGKAHFFGSHPKELCNDSDYPLFVSAFDEAARNLKGVRIINCNRQSALRCFEFGDLA